MVPGIWKEQRQIHFRKSHNCCPPLRWHWPQQLSTYIKQGLQSQWWWSEITTVWKVLKYSAACSGTSIHHAPWRPSSGDQTLTGPGQQGCNASVCTGAPSTRGPLGLGRADRCGTGPTRDMHPSGMSTRGHAILGHSMAPDDHTEASELKHKWVFPF